MIRLSICIPTVVGREEKYQRLYDLLQQQIDEAGRPLGIEIITAKDNKEKSIGAKRDLLYNQCAGLYAVQIDDDDLVADDYILKVYDATFKNADCITYQEHCLFDGVNPKLSDFSIRHGRWYEVPVPVNGFSHFRTPFFKTPIRTDLCKQVGVKDMRYGEDHDFSVRILPLLKTEHYIRKPLYLYRYESEPHNQKYGIE